MKKLLTYYLVGFAAVIKKLRKKGIATLLQHEQHKKCEELGYRYLQTITSNQNLAMQIINLKSGYQVIGTKLVRASELNILFEKKI